MSSSTVLSLYIPVISGSTTENYIKKMFDQHKVGKVMRVDFVKNIAKNRREAFIHFDEWYTTDQSFKLQQDILNPSTNTRFTYTPAGRFWPLLVNKNAHKRVNNPNYEMVDLEEIKKDCKQTVGEFIKNEKANILDKNQEVKRSKTWAEVV